MELNNENDDKRRNILTEGDEGRSMCEKRQLLYVRTPDEYMRF